MGGDDAMEGEELGVGEGVRGEEGAGGGDEVAELGGEKGVAEGMGLDLTALEGVQGKDQRADPIVGEGLE